ncbi:uncharacterized protein LOC129132041 [Agelaius phoeniceus]|uniref:uncharacterized protein LOC129132041 n=1 Tax=Agelaius phoeniceus TaxID=39638 RepID=UPI00405515CC
MSRYDFINHYEEIAAISGASVRAREGRQRPEPGEAAAAELGGGPSAASGDGAAPSVPAAGTRPSQRCSGSGSCRGSGCKETAGSRSRSALTPAATRAGHGTTNPPEPPAAPEARSEPRAPAQPSAPPTCVAAASQLRRRLTVLHSLRYLYVAVSEPSPGIPQFMSIGYLDGIPFTRFDSERGWVEPLTQWIKDGAEQEYWERETQISVKNQHINLHSQIPTGILLPPLRSSSFCPYPFWSHSGHSCFR